jgi:hypothetical protein
MTTHTARLLPLFAACALLSACAQPLQAPAVTVAGEVRPVAMRPAVMPALTPLERLVGYRLSALETESAPLVAVLGVAPPVSGANGQHQRFMVRPAIHEVMKIDAAGHVAAWGGLGGEPGRFNRPESLSVTADRVYVADTGNHRVQVFDLDGRFVAAWGAFGNRPGQFHAPRAVEVTVGGMIVVTDDVRIQYFDPSGAHVAELPLVLPTAAAGPRAVLQAGTKPAAGAGAIAALNADLFDQMALFQQLALALRGEARAAHRDAMVAQAAELQRAAEQIRQAAEHRFSAAVTAGLMSQAAGVVTGGAIGAVSAGVGVGSLTSKVGGLTSKSTEGVGKRGAASATTRAPGGVGAGRVSGVGAGMTAIGAGLGTSLGGGSGQAEAKSDAAAEKDASARADDAARQQSEDLMREMMEVIRDVREKLAEIEQSTVETNRVIARGI